MVFSGSLVAAGRGTVLVTGTGMNTEIGRIAALMNSTGEKKTPLQISLDQFGSHLAAGNTDHLRLCSDSAFTAGCRFWTP